ncbi:hypothetical protein TNCT_637181 [Trichonephila clavata]|uniref:Uncharacterized protein n=1 Tax=Trichonephila clavata TaxID=2740835 RepID=A0A8X6IAC4_TRICU|nr:hypothetical protein TNCT_637181 [Trichonephila clavata]
MGGEYFRKFENIPILSPPRVTIPGNKPEKYSEFRRRSDQLSVPGGQNAATSLVDGVPFPLLGTGRLGYRRHVQLRVTEYGEEDPEKETLQCL